MVRLDRLLDGLAEVERVGPGPFEVPCPKCKAGVFDQCRSVRPPHKVLKNFKFHHERPRAAVMAGRRQRRKRKAG